MHHAIPLLSLLILGACSQETLAPSSDQLGPSLRKVAPSPCEAFFDTEMLSLNGLNNWPVGGASLQLTPMGKLRVSNAAMSDEFGVCTELPRVTGVTMQYQGFPTTVEGENGWVIDLAGSSGPVGELGVRRMRNGRLRGFFDVAANRCGLLVETFRNGQLIRSASGNRVSFPLPPNFGILGWSWGGTNSGSYHLIGTNAAGDRFEIRGTPTNTLAQCRPTLTEAISRFGGTMGPVTFFDIFVEIGS